MEFNDSERAGNAWGKWRARADEWYARADGAHKITSGTEIACRRRGNDKVRQSTATPGEGRIGTTSATSRYNGTRGNEAHGAKLSQNSEMAHNSTGQIIPRQ